MRARVSRMHLYCDHYIKRRGLALSIIHNTLSWHASLVRGELLTPSRCQTLTRFLELIQAELVGYIYIRSSQRTLTQQTRSLN